MSTDNPTHLDNWTLGKKKTEYKDQYDPTLLVPIERAPRRKNFRHIMFGEDIWDCFEFSFLNENGLPQYRVFRLWVDCMNPFIFESKSLKLYLNSFSNSRFPTFRAVKDIIEKDLGNLSKGRVTIQKISEFPLSTLSSFPEEICVSHLERDYPETVCDKYNVDETLLESKRNNSDLDSYLFFTDLLRSNCEETGQQDLARCYIHIKPSELEIEPHSLLRYLVSYRNHQEFHEPTCERIYQHLYDKFLPKELTVICQYTRRGGIGINPVRSNNPSRIDSIVLEKLLQQ